mmetsp:Transcript_7931/g.22733  ORF Transcript_7931/g.22733 Transcript_7931/m.22733 type:complete len:224 (+) Transcript_7931:2-673(+)
MLSGDVGELAGAGKHVVSERTGDIGVGGDAVCPFQALSAASDTQKGDASSFDRLEARYNRQLSRQTSISSRNGSAEHGHGGARKVTMPPAGLMVRRGAAGQGAYAHSVVSGTTAQVLAQTLILDAAGGLGVGHLDRDEWTSEEQAKRDSFLPAIRETIGQLDGTIEPKIRHDGVGESAESLIVSFGQDFYTVGSRYSNIWPAGRRNSKWGRNGSDKPLLRLVS